MLASAGGVGNCKIGGVDGFVGEHPTTRVETHNSSSRCFDILNYLPLYGDVDGTDGFLTGGTLDFSHVFVILSSSLHFERKVVSRSFTLFKSLRSSFVTIV